MSFKIYLLNLRMSKGTVSRSEQQINAFIKWADHERIDVEKITYANVLEYIAYCRQKGNNQYTVSRKVRTLKYYLDYMFVRPNPCKGLLIPTRTQGLPSPILTKEQLNELYNNYPDYSNELVRDKVILGLLCYQAMGSTEIRSLVLDDIYLEIDFIRLRKTTKLKARSLRIDPLQRSLLVRYLERIRLEILNAECNLVVVRSDRCQHPDQLRNFMFTLSKRFAAYSDLFKNYLQIRASVLCNWTKHHNLREVQYMAGHKNINATERYLEGNMEELSRQLDKYHPLR